MVEEGNDRANFSLCVLLLKFSDKLCATSYKINLLQDIVLLIIIIISKNTSTEFFAL